ncbi:MAG: V-type ATP synthase subunit E family protein [Candidatus Korarchaeota archaeon]|nr:V-type ATP synthase subunit E family protein [Candidatus Korarchaeota archaeon]
MSGEEVVSVDKDSEAIVRAILKMAEDRADAIRKEAEKRAKEIIESARRKAEEILRSKRERAEREMREEIARKRSAAEVEANQIVLMTKSELLSEFFRRVHEKLAAIADGQEPGWNYEEILTRYSLEGAKVLGEKEVLLMGREKDRSLLEKVARKLEKEDIKASVDERTVPVIGGVVVRDSRDERRYYNTFDGRLRAYRETKEIEIIGRLFEGV